ncbi:MAG: hypothetical protein GX640_03730 [Fibrobacter sp.]|nr:hypothetical protein [Fibrobacter sp.]
MERKISLIDTTLRDGALAPHVSISLSEKIHIVNMLREAGIKIFEAGIPAMGDTECKEITILAQTYPDCTFIAWCRADLSDIEKSVQCGIDTIHVSFPVSKQHMAIQKLTEDDVLNKLDDILKVGLSKFKTVSIGAQDASRANPDFLKRFILKAYSGGACRIRIADTVGILSPLSTMAMVKGLLQLVPGSALEFHCHNDLGMATANTLVALQSGADYASVTVNGTGERAGNAPLEEVVMAIKETTDLQLEFKTESINTLCKDVSIITNQPIPKTKPVIGENVFCHESGIHCNGQLKNSSAYEPYDPLKTGHSKSSFVAGTHSGKAGIMSILKKYDISTTYEELETLLPVIRECSRSMKKSLDEKETVMLYMLYRHRMGK